MPIHRHLAVVFWLLMVVAVEAPGIQGKPDSIAVIPKEANVEPVRVQGVSVPTIDQRLVTLGVLLVILGGFGFLVNEKRRRADRQER